MFSNTCRHGVGEAPVQEFDDFKNQSVVYVGVDGVLAGLIYVEDQLREDARHVVESLSKQGISTYLLSGDKKNAAEYVASVVGIPKENVRISNHFQLNRYCRLGIGLYASYLFIFLNGKMEPVTKKSRILPLPNPNYWKWQIAKWCFVQVFYGVKPDEKSKFVSGLQMDQKVVAMVGDGINDAAALASSHVGVAIGGGVGAASDVSSVVLMQNRLSQV